VGGALDPVYTSLPITKVNDGWLELDHGGIFIYTTVTGQTINQGFCFTLFCSVLESLLLTIY
jgi:hypothetical protein